jgi:hypothetical protein
LRTLIDRLRAGAGRGRRDVEAHRRAARSLADACDPVSWKLQTIIYARSAEPRSYTEPGVPAIWERVRQEARETKSAYDSHRGRILSDEPEVRRSVGSILDACTEVEEAVHRHGWTSHAVDNKLEHLLTTVERFQGEMSAQSRRSVRV